MNDAKALKSRHHVSEVPKILLSFELQGYSDFISENNVHVLDPLFRKSRSSFLNQALCIQNTLRSLSSTSVSNRKQTCLAEPNGKGKRKMWYDILFLRYNVALSRRAYTKYRTWHDLFFFLHLYNGTGQLKLFHLFVEFEGNIFADFIYKLSRVSFDGKLKIMAQKD